jgi:hypothetical protein
MKHVAQYSIERETDQTVHDRNDTFAIVFSLSIRDILNIKSIFPYAKFILHRDLHHVIYINWDTFEHEVG